MDTTFAPGQFVSYRTGATIRHGLVEKVGRASVKVLGSNGKRYAVPFAVTRVSTQEKFLAEVTTATPTVAHFLAGVAGINY